MSNLEDYNKKIEDIKTITDDQIKTPHHVPVGIYTQEAEYLYEWCQEDKDDLTAKGLVWTVVEDLPVRCGALSVAESKWFIQQSQRRASAKIWPKELSKGYNLRNELIHHFKYAFRDNSSLIEKVKEIANRSTNDGMIDGLYDLNVLGLVNRELLIKIGFDFSLLDMAAQKSRELATKMEAASFYSEDYLETKKIRDQAYTHLKEAVDYIREYGKYVFWINSARLKGYRSEYRRKLKQRTTRRNRVTEPEPGNVPETIDV
jgi:hypothetical protein